MKNFKNWDHWTVPLRIDFYDKFLSSFGEKKNILSLAVYKYKDIPKERNPGQPAYNFLSCTPKTAFS